MITELKENETANILENEKSKIMFEWLEHVRDEVIIARTKSDAQIYNHLGEFLNTMISALRTDHKSELLSETRELSREHGEQRFLLKGYTLDQIIHEFHLLRETIFEYLIVQRNVNLSEDDRTIINSFIDNAIQSTAVEFMNIESEVQQKIRFELEEALEKLKVTVKARDTFLSLASHELKTPLTTLLLQAQIKRRQLAKGQTNYFEGDKLKEMIETDIKQLGSLNRLIDDMLDIGRIRTGRLELKKETFDLGETAKNVFEKYLPQVQEKCSHFDFNVEDNIFVEADQERIVQVISNLLNNAMKYGQCKPLAAKVFCDHVNRKAFIVVRDNGMGISEDDRQRIFQIFERAISPNEVSGLGLGLAIVKEIVGAHGGEILVDSEVGVGSTFTVSLPIVQVH